jgi:hypothetical protein
MEEVKGNPILSEIHIEDGELSKEKRFVIIESIYDKFLQEDPLWHFFYEEEVGDIIRCSPENLEPIKKFLDECGFKYKWSDTWVETIYEVVNNPEYFAELFHLNSEFIVNKALKVGKNMASIIDRYSHSLYINYHFSIEEDKQPGEAQILSDVLLSRAFYDGIRFQYLRNKKLYEQSKNGKSS